MTIPAGFSAGSLAHGQVAKAPPPRRSRAGQWRGIGAQKRKSRKRSRAANDLPGIAFGQAGRFVTILAGVLGAPAALWGAFD